MISTFTALSLGRFLSVRDSTVLEAMEETNVQRHDPCLALFTESLP